jgi:predicted cupin superfamily sugar epimerase/mannose-6-phosphate isomerase-like protein (cupin superfamily)
MISTYGRSADHSRCLKLFRKTAPLVAFALTCLSVVHAAGAVGQAKKLIDRLGMEKIPVEGCWFKVTYSSADKLAAAALPARYGTPRIAGGAIYALVTREDFSAMHRLKTDEIWHFYAGDPMQLLLLYPDGRSEVIVLGSDLLAGQSPQFTVSAGVWMGARPVAEGEESYGFFGTTMAPGFDPEDFEPGYRDELQRTYPAQRKLIGDLTRAELTTRPSALTAAPPVAPPPPPVFATESVEKITVAPGVELRELTGRVARAKTNDYSIARFTLAPGRGTGTSYNKVGEEVFLILSGRGTVVVGTEASAVIAGSVVVLKPQVRHSLTAAADSTLEFDAITVPAFSPDDYVLLPEKH